MEFGALGETVRWANIAVLMPGRPHVYLPVLAESPIMAKATISYEATTLPVNAAT